MLNNISNAKPRVVVMHRFVSLWNLVSIIKQLQMFMYSNCCLSHILIMFSEMTCHQAVLMVIVSTHATVLHWNSVVILTLMSVQTAVNHASTCW